MKNRDWRHDLVSMYVCYGRYRLREERVLDTEIAVDVRGRRLGSVVTDSNDYIATKNHWTKMLRMWRDVAITVI